MPGPDETVVVAVIAAGRPLAVAAVAAWDAGEAILPINPAAPRAERDRLLGSAAPDARRRRRAVAGELRGGSAPADTAASS